MVSKFACGIQDGAVEIDVRMDIFTVNIGADKKACLPFVNSFTVS